jgi:hypothetical protein
MGWHLKIHLFFSLSMNFLTKPVLFVFSVYDNCHSCSVFCFFPFLFSDVALLAIIQNKIWHKLAKCLYKIVKTIKKLVKKTALKQKSVSKCVEFFCKISKNGYLLYNNRDCETIFCNLRVVFSEILHRWELVVNCKLVFSLANRAKNLVPSLVLNNF